jgi:hypothetical protein
MRKNWAAERTRPKHERRRERPHRAAQSRPDPCGLRGSLPPLAARESQLVFWPRGENRTTQFVMHFAIQIATMKGDQLCRC